MAQTSRNRPPPCPHGVVRPHGGAEEDDSACQCRHRQVGVAKRAPSERHCSVQLPGTLIFPAIVGPVQDRRHHHATAACAATLTPLPSLASPRSPAPLCHRCSYRRDPRRVRVRRRLRGADRAATFLGCLAPYPEAPKRSEGGQSEAPNERTCAGCVAVASDATRGFAKPIKPNAASRARMRCARKLGHRPA